MQPTEPEGKLVNQEELAGEGDHCRPANESADETHQGPEHTSTNREFLGGRTAASFVGTVLNRRFELISLVGEGGMSYVFSAKDILLNKIVAVKMLRPYLLHDSNSIRRLHKEAMAASSLEHPNTAGIRHFDFTDDGLPFIVMDFLKGSSLAEMISKGGAFEPRRATRIVRQIALALGHAHDKGIIHRDLKASNVIVINEADKLDLVKVVDFGIAKIATIDGGNLAHLTQTGEIFGSPIVMSPEQCRGTQVDARSDVYSLGCLMYEMLTGKPVFDTKNTLELLFKQLNEMPDSFKMANPQAKIEPELEAITFKALQKDPQNRYADMNELVADLDALERKTVLSSVVSRVTLAASNKKRNQILRNTFAGALVGLTILAIALFAGTKRLYGDDSLLASVFPWQLRDAASSRQAVSSDPAALQQIQRVEAHIARVCPSTQEEINEHPPASLRSESGIRQAIVDLSEDAQSLGKLPAAQQLGTLSEKIDALGKSYLKFVKQNVPQQDAAAVVAGLTKAGDALFAAGDFEQACTTYGAAQTVVQAYEGHDTADEQFFAKLMGDCDYQEVASGQRPQKDYERACQEYDHVFPPKDDLRLVARDRYRLIGDEDFGATNDLSTSPLVWDAHRKRAESLYGLQKYHDALDDFQWIEAHRLAKKVADLEEALLCWQAADCKRLKVGESDSDHLAAEAVKQYALPKIWLAKKDPKNLALANAYIAAMAQQYHIAPEEMPPDSLSLAKALEQMRTIYGADHPATLLTEKQLASSYGLQGQHSRALALVLDVLARKLHWH